MSVKLRLQRHGRTHRPFYHIVATDSRQRRDGRFIEKIGTYDAVMSPARVELNHEAAMKWLKTGAQPTDTVRAILSDEGLMLQLHLHRKGKSAEEIQAGFAKWLDEKTKRDAAATAKKDQAKQVDKDERLAGERKKADARAAKQAARLAAAVPVALPVAEEAAEVAAPEVAVELAPIAEVSAPEVVAEVAAPEAVAEVAPVAEVAAPEVVAEAPAPEVVAEVAPEAPAAEEKTDAPAE